jgi:hypothetical protein
MGLKISDRGLAFLRFEGIDGKEILGGRDSEMEIGYTQ